MKLALLSHGTNAKTVKSDKGGQYLTAILYLAPANVSSRNVCPYASEGCRMSCLNTAGRGKFNNVQAARLRKTELFHADRDAFMAKLADDCAQFEAYCKRKGKKAAIRLNGTSDIAFETLKVGGFSNLMDAFKSVTFYDYTKWPSRLRCELPANYTLTYSRKETDDKAVVLENLRAGRNVAVVFAQLPTFWAGREVIDGDVTDLRFLDKAGVIVGLKAKGMAKNDTSGFVV